MVFSFSAHQTPKRGCHEQKSPHPHRSLSVAGCVCSGNVDVGEPTAERHAREAWNGAAFIPFNQRDGGANPNSILKCVLPSEVQPLVSLPRGDAIEAPKFGSSFLL